MAQHIIPQLPEGKKYRVILRSPGYTFTKSMLTAFGGTIPVLNLPRNCICCNVATDSTKNVEPFEDNRYLSEPMQIPLCPACYKHGFMDPGSMMLRLSPVLLGGIGLILAIYKFTTTNPIAFTYYLFAGSLAVTGFGAYLIYSYNQRFKNMEHGHHPGAHIGSVTPGQLSVETTNKTLVQNILAYNPETVHLVNTTAEAESMR